MGILKLPYGTDTDVHLSSEPVIALMKKRNPFQYENGFIGTAEEYITREMEPLGIESAWIWLNPHGALFDREIYEEENRFICQVSNADGRFRPFGWLSYFKDEDAQDRRDRLRRFFDEYGFCGIKINIEDTAYTQNDAFRLTEAFLGPELDFISSHYPKKLVICHTGINVKDRKAHPELVGALAQKYTDLRFVMVHTGACPGMLVNEYHWDAIGTMQKNRNVHGILSMINPASVLDVYRSIKGGLIETEQVVVGSDYPYNRAIGTIDSRYNLACHPELDFTEAQIRKIITGNAERLTRQ